MPESFLSRLLPDRQHGVQVLITLAPDDTTFAVIGTHDALTLRNVVFVSTYEPYVISRVGADGSPPHGQVAIELFRGGAMPIPHAKLDVLSVFFMRGLQQVLGARWARGFAVVVRDVTSLAECLGGYQEVIVRQALRQPLTGARKITFERYTS